MKIVDAMAQPCPKPVMMTRDLVAAGERELAVYVDNAVAAENVTRFLDKAGYSVLRFENDGSYRIEARLSKGSASGENEPAKARDAHFTGAHEREAGRSYAFMILSQNLGADSDGLGEVLMKSFLGTLPSRRPAPAAIALLNDGVKLALAESTCSETLKELERIGVEVLVCGTCTKHYGIMDEIAVGRISNMFEITETVFGTGKPIVLG